MKFLFEQREVDLNIVGPVFKAELANLNPIKRTNYKFLAKEIFWLPTQVGFWVLEKEEYLLILRSANNCFWLWIEDQNPFSLDINSVKKIFKYLSLSDLRSFRATNKENKNMVDVCFKDLGDRRYLYLRKAKKFKPDYLTDNDWLRKVLINGIADIIFKERELVSKELNIRPDFKEWHISKRFESFFRPFELNFYRWLEYLSPGYIKANFDKTSELFELFAKWIGYAKNWSAQDREKIIKIAEYFISLGIVPSQTLPELNAPIKFVKSDLTLPILAWYGWTPILDILARSSPPILMGKIEIIHELSGPDPAYNKWIKTLTREQIDSYLLNLIDLCSKNVQLWNLSRFIQKNLVGKWQPPKY